MELEELNRMETRNRLSLGAPSGTILPLQQLQIGKNRFFVQAIQNKWWEAAWVLRRFPLCDLQAWKTACLPSICKDAIEKGLLDPSVGLEIERDLLESFSTPKTSSSIMPLPIIPVQQQQTNMLTTPQGGTRSTASFYPSEEEQYVLERAWQTKLEQRRVSRNPMFSMPHMFYCKREIQDAFKAKAETIKVALQADRRTSTIAIVCLSGPPGCGKTTLALRVLSELGFQTTIVAPWFSNTDSSLYASELDEDDLVSSFSNSRKDAVPNIPILENVDLWKHFSADGKPSCFLRVFHAMETLWKQKTDHGRYDTLQNQHQRRQASLSTLLSQSSSTRQHQKRAYKHTRLPLIFVTQRETFGSERDMDWSRANFVLRLSLEPEGGVGMPPPSSSSSTNFSKREEQFSLTRVVRSTTEKFFLVLEDVCFWMKKRHDILRFLDLVPTHVCASCFQTLAPTRMDSTPHFANLFSRIRQYIQVVLSCQTCSTLPWVKTLASLYETRTAMQDRKMVESYLNLKFQNQNAAIVCRDLEWQCIEVTARNVNLEIAAASRTRVSEEKESNRIDVETLSNNPAAFQAGSCVAVAAADNHNPREIASVAADIHRGYVWARSFLLVSQTLICPLHTSTSNTTLSFSLLSAKHLLHVPAMADMTRKFHPLFDFLPFLRTLDARERQVCITLLYNSLYELVCLSMQACATPQTVLGLLACVADEFCKLSVHVQEEDEMSQIEKRRHLVLVLFDLFLRERLGPRIAHKRLEMSPFGADSATIPKLKRFEGNWPRKSIFAWSKPTSDEKNNPKYYTQQQRQQYQQRRDDDWLMLNNWFTVSWPPQKTGHLPLSDFLTKGKFPTSSKHEEVLQTTRMPKKHKKPRFLSLAPLPATAAAATAPPTPTLSSTTGARLKPTSTHSVPFNSISQYRQQRHQRYSSPEAIKSCLLGRAFFWSSDAVEEWKRVRVSSFETSARE